MRSKALILISLLALLGSDGSVCALLCLVPGAPMHAGAFAPPDAHEQAPPCEQHRAPDPAPGEHPMRTCDDPCPGCQGIAAKPATAPADVPPPGAAPVFVQQPVARPSPRLPQSASLLASGPSESPPPRTLLYRKSSLRL